METDAKVIQLEAKIARLMTARRNYRTKIREIGEQIDKLEINVRLRKVEISNVQREKRMTKV
jgi:hypothetical protein